MRREIWGGVIAAVVPFALAAAQVPGYPKYCCTDAGRFGPFSNGTVNVGGRCSVVTREGRRVVGKACHGPAAPSELGPMDTTGYAQHCCTDVGVLGPVADATWQEGEPCKVRDVDGRLRKGKACYGVTQSLRRARAGEPLLLVVDCGVQPGGMLADVVTQVAAASAP